MLTQKLALRESKESDEKKYLNIFYIFNILP